MLEVFQNLVGRRAEIRVLAPCEQDGENLLKIDRSVNAREVPKRAKRRFPCHRIRLDQLKAAILHPSPVALMERHLDDEPRFFERIFSRKYARSLRKCELARHLHQ